MPKDLTTPPKKLSPSEVIGGTVPDELGWVSAVKSVRVTPDSKIVAGWEDTSNMPNGGEASLRMLVAAGGGISLGERTRRATFTFLLEVEEVRLVVVRAVPRRSSNSTGGGGEDGVRGAFIASLWRPAEAPAIRKELISAVKLDRGADMKGVDRNWELDELGLELELVLLLFREEEDCNIEAKVLPEVRVSDFLFIGELNTINILWFCRMIR